ncbi:MAG: hypothetical protein LBH86_03265, partial [Oscillospiraceae bacterium]|nr:hypothetical protein [Oscillospiraceae bacterium]
MGILAAYDTAGIQNYIFASNKLAENVGGSKLVADIFDKLLPEVIGEATDQPVADWRGGGALNRALRAELLYQGGGNAFVAFRDEPLFQAVTKAFLTRMCQNAPGLGLAVAAIETEFEDTYKEDFDRLGKRLAIVKGGFNVPAFAGNQPITKQSARTGAPASSFAFKEFLSDSQVKKRERYAVYKSERGSEIDNFSDLAFDKGADSLIAIIHADGNNMGRRIKASMSPFVSYAQAVPEIRALSAKIDACYKAARARTISAFRSEYKRYLAGQKADFPAKKFRDEPPILELIGDGDDTTLVIGGRFALDFAARLLREIEKTPAAERPFADSALTACAGVVLFHDHYPFSDAYTLAEELCAEAKTSSRKCKQDGSCIDFHLHQSGTVSGLRRLRERQYTVDGKKILCRPWRVSGGSSDAGTENAPPFEWFEKNI